MPSDSIAQLVERAVDQRSQRCKFKSRLSQQFFCWLYLCKVIVKFSLYVFMRIWGFFQKIESNVISLVFLISLKRSRNKIITLYRLISFNSPEFPIRSIFGQHFRQVFKKWSKATFLYVITFRKKNRKWKKISKHA